MGLDPYTGVQTNAHVSVINEKGESVMFRTEAFYLLKEIEVIQKCEETPEGVMWKLTQPEENIRRALRYFSHFSSEPESIIQR